MKRRKDHAKRYTFMRLLCFGEILWDVVGDTKHLGGAPFNLAVHASRCGLEAGIISSLGNDALGHEAHDIVANHPVDTRFLQQDPHPTGRVDVAVSSAGQPSYTIHEDVAFDHIDLSTADLDVVVEQAVDFFCYGTLAQRGAVSRSSLQRLLPRLQGGQAKLFCDVNLRQSYYNRSILESSIQACDILKLNDEEVPVVAAEFCRSTPASLRDFCHTLARQMHIAVVLVTLGEAGAGIYTAGDYQTIPGTAVEVVDTIGAGDAFSAAYLSATLKGCDPMAAVALANQVGAYVASHAGALPDYDEELKTRVLCV